MTDWGTEGYCKYCAMVIAVDDGLMVKHGSWREYQPERDDCEGSGKPPAKKTPYASKKFAFRVSAPSSKCPACEQEVGVDRFGFYKNHRIQCISPFGFKWCTNGGKRKRGASPSGGCRSTLAAPASVREERT